MKQLYTENSLVYKISDNRLFSGIAQVKRKNGHLVYEEEFKDGIILSSNLYFNGKEVRISNKTIYNPKKPFKFSKQYEYHLNGDIFEITTYNYDGIKILVEQFTNGKLIYSCQYLGKKKHGIELGYLDDGEKMTFRCEYINGKKHGIEYCLLKDGIETIKEFNHGKRIK